MPVTITSMATSPADSKAIIDTNFSNLKTKADLIENAAIVAPLTVAAFDSATTTGTVKGGYNFVRLTDANVDAMWDGSTWLYFYEGAPIGRPDVVTGWSWVNQGSSVLTTLGTHLKITDLGSSAENFRIRARSLAGSTFTVTAKFFPHNALAGGTMRYGLILRESATGKLVYVGGTQGTQANVVNFSSPTAGSSTPVTVTVGGMMTPGLYTVRASGNGTNVTYSISFDNGLSFTTLFDAVKTSFFTSGPDQAGFFVSNPNAPTKDMAITLVSWVQV